VVKCPVAQESIPSISRVTELVEGDGAVKHRNKMYQLYRKVCGTFFPAYHCSIHVNQFGPPEDGRRTSLQNFLADHMGLAQVFLQELWFSPVSIIPQIFQYHYHYIILATDR
jgi:hypothetical protein